MSAMGDSRLELASVVEMFEDVGPQVKRSYPEDLAFKLRGRLLLIHGMLDTEVTAYCHYAVD